MLPKIISHIQSAFVPDRLISDNSLVDLEIVHFMHKNNGWNSVLRKMTFVVDG